MKVKTKTWLELALNDLDFAGEILANGKRPHYAAHFCHQAIEKLLKAVVQEVTDTSPHRTHNLKALCLQASIELPIDKMQWLMDLAPHYMGTRYPEDIFQLHKHYTQKFSENLYRETEDFFKWIKNKYLK